MIPWRIHKVMITLVMKKKTICKIIQNQKNKKKLARAPQMIVILT